MSAGHIIVQTKKMSRSLRNTKNEIRHIGHNIYILECLFTDACRPHQANILGEIIF